MRNLELLDDREQVLTVLGDLIDKADNLHRSDYYALAQWRDEVVDLLQSSFVEFRSRG